MSVSELSITFPLKVIALNVSIGIPRMPLRTKKHVFSSKISAKAFQSINRPVFKVIRDIFHKTFIINLTLIPYTCASYLHDFFKHVNKY